MHRIYCECTKEEGREERMEAEKILVVDDNKEIVYSISELLKYEGYETLKAYDGMEALFLCLL